MSEIVIERGPRDPLGHPGKETVQPGVTMLAVVGEGDKTMFKFEFRAVARLTALNLARSDGGSPDDRLLPEAKIEKPLTTQSII